MFRYKWMKMLYAAVLLAVIIGVRVSISPIYRFNYLGYGLYNCIAELVAANVNTLLAHFAAILYGFWLVYIIGRAFSGLKRIAVWSIGYILAIIATIRAMDAIHGQAIQAIDSLHFQFFGMRTLPLVNICQMVKQFTSVSTIYPILREFGLQLLVALVLVVIGIVVLSRNRSIPDKPRITNSSSPKSPSFQRFAAISSRILGVAVGLCMIFLVCANLIAGAYRIKEARNVQNKPNIILIAVDTLRADHLGCYGYVRNTSPHLDALARSGIRFDKAYSQAPWTTASFGSLMTSLYTQTIDPGTVFGPNPIGEEHMTLAEYLRDQGYKTGAIVGNPYFGDRFHGDQGFDIYDQTHADGESDFSPPMVTDAKDVIARLQNQRFFLFMLFMDVHAAYHNHKGFRFKEGLPRSYPLTLGDCTPAPRTASDIEGMKAEYDSGIAYTDHYINMVFDELKKRHLYDNSIIIFLADHGDEFHDHGALYHGHTLYNELLHVPLIIKLPNQTEGLVAKRAFPLINVFPSIAKFIKSDMPTFHPQGVAADLRNTDKLPAYDIFAATHGEFSPKEKDLRSIQSSGYKYIFDGKSGQEQLFDLFKDPLEHSNIARQDPSLASRLRKTLDVNISRWERARTQKSTPSAKVEFNDSEKARLKSLGYL